MLNVILFSATIQLLISLFHCFVSGISRIYYLKHAHYTIMGVFKYLMQNIKGFNDLGLRQASTHEAMLYAAKNGTIQFINAMREVNSDLLSVTDDSGRGIFWHAILNRRQEVFQLVYFLNGLEKDMFRYHSDSFDNELLNMAALFVPLSSYNHILCPVTEVQREWQWFQVTHLISWSKFTLPLYKKDNFLFISKSNGVSSSNSITCQTVLEFCKI
jgi:hypothetical protein